MFPSYLSLGNGNLVSGVAFLNAPALQGSCPCSPRLPLGSVGAGGSGLVAPPQPAPRGHFLGLSPSPLQVGPPSAKYPHASTQELVVG